jgi:hypothetical protein
MLPFDVPAGTTAIRVKYCHDQPELAPPGSPARHTLDLGVYEPKQDPPRTWGVPEFRGWGGSSHPDVTVSPEGFSTEAQYTADPRIDPPGKTTRAFRPGPIPVGEWAVELGVASVVSQGDADGKVGWRVEIDLSDDPAFATEPYQPADYEERAAKSDPAWYAGDFHVHAEHSAYGDATMTETFDHAFGSLAEGKAGLDFITLSDYVSGSAWGEIGRFQDDYPGKLIGRSAEVITYRGHVNNHNSATVVDYREGRIYERASDGALTQVRGPQDASAIFGQIRAAGGYTQINHPTIFPSSVPIFAALCRGCPWDYTDAETDYSKVDAIEIATGPPGLRQPPNPGPNPFTVTAIEFWEDKLGKGHRIAAVGSSDSHNAGRTPNPATQAPIGTATTVVFAEELSEEGLKQGVEAGHTYVKVFGNDAPDLRFEARVVGSSAPPAIMGDTVRADEVDFVARVLGGGPSFDSFGPFQLIVFKDGETPVQTVPVTSDDFSLAFKSSGPGRYRLQLQRGSAIEAVSSPIYVEPAADGNGDGGGGGDGGAGGGGDGGGEGRGGDSRDTDAGAGEGDAGEIAGAAEPGEEGLPFTGLPLALILATGLALAGAGLLARRRGRNG